MKKHMLKGYKIPLTIVSRCFFFKPFEEFKHYLKIPFRFKTNLDNTIQEGNMEGNMKGNMNLNAQREAQKCGERIRLLK